MGGRDAEFGAAMARLRADRGLSLRALEQRVHYSRSYLSDIERGRRPVTPQLAAACDEALGASGALAELGVVQPPEDDELAACELAQRALATDIGATTLELLETAVDDLATAYPVTPPRDLAQRVRRHLRYVARLLDGRKTLAEHRRLLVTGGWLSLLGATVAIDDHARPAGAARLRTAEALADEVDHREMRAWCAETRAWDALTEGDYAAAAELSRQAQQIAPSGGSARVQATAQEGRALARLGDRRKTWQALDRVHRLAAALPEPARPEHHYQYDPTKLTAYTATTLAWLGDPAAEEPARKVIGQLESDDDGRRWPRRVASARLDLALALVAAGRPDEAAAEGLCAVRSGCVVPSNRWRAREVVTAVTGTGLPGAAELADAYRLLTDR